MIRKQGSCLLLILSIVFILLVALLKCWRISSLRVDVQNQREIYYRRFYLIDNVLKTTINAAGKNFDQFIKSEMPVKINLTEEVKNSGYAAFGQIRRVVIKKKVKPDELVVSAFLTDENNDVVFTLKCLLEKKPIAGRLETKFVISGCTIL